MVKTLSTNNTNTIDDQVIIPVHFITLNYSPTPLRLNTTERNFTVGGNSFVGGSGIANLSSIEETQELQATGIKLTLSGLPSSNISIALTTNFKNVDATLELGFLNTTSYTLIDTPFTIFKGKIDTQDIQIDQDSATVVIEIENRLIDWERPRIKRYTNQDQQQEFANDKGLEFIQQLQEKELFWGVVK
tara:strand:+ start:82 stop:648 length:567 start_codon:yes stop_codon:yes gene_type:complete